MLVLVGFCSCQKEEVNASKTESVSLEFQNLKEGGDDDEDPIVQGKVVDGEDNPVGNAFVEIYEDGAAFPLDSTTTDATGEFEFQVPMGSYYLMVTLPGQNPVSSDVFEVESNVQITIEV